MALGVIAIFALPSIAAAKDRNNDRIPDRWEKRHHLSLKVKQTRRDQDSDHLKNLGEFSSGTNPRRADSDGDGIADGKEAAVGDDPADDDSDNDGTEDGDENAGTVGSFDGTTLTINLAAGGTISGLVTDRTEIKCETEDDSSENPSGTDRRGHRREGGSDHEGGEDNPGDDDSGDDDGEHGDHGEHGDCDEENPCTVDDLVEGAVVHEAEIRVSGDGAVFKEIQLIKSSDSSA
jgi:hypothetical protein